MDSEDEARDYDSMDQTERNRRFAEDLLSFCPNVGEALDVGTRTARNPIELRARVTEARVVGIDLAEHVRARIARADDEK